MENINSYVKAIIDKLVVQILWTAAGGAIAVSAAYFVGRNYKFSILEIILCITLTVFCILLLSYIIYRRNTNKIAIYPVMEHDFIMIKEERIHRLISENSGSHKRRYKLKPTKNGLTEYVDKFQWTGGKYLLLGGGEDYTIEQNGKTKNVFDLYYFKFKKPLKKDGIIELEAEWQLEGSGKPFFSTLIEEPTEELVMKIIINSNLSIKYVNCEVEPCKGAKTAFKSDKVKLNSDGEYEWKVTRPKLLFHYEINW